MFDKKNNKLAGHHGLLALVIAVLLGLILIVLIFKTGMMVGGSKSHFSSYKAGNHYKNFSGHLGGKFSGWKKSSYSTYQEVIKLTDTGFVVKGADGEEQVVVITEDTVILKGKEKTGNGVSIGDKVYVIGTSDEKGQVEASMIKVFDPNAKGLKKLLK